MIKLKTLSKRDRVRRTDRILVIFALVTLVIAYIVGIILNGTDFAPSLKQALPEAERFEELVGLGARGISSPLRSGCSRGSGPVRLGRGRVARGWRGPMG